jgi:hypothetical protein
VIRVYYYYTKQASVPKLTVSSIQIYTLDKTPLINRGPQQQINESYNS